jgi:hypothetical protein
VTTEQEARIEEIVKLLKIHKPKTVEATRKLGIKLRFIADGAYRNTYKIKDVPLVMKFPKGRSGRDHSSAEIQTIRTINKKKMYKPLREFMPTMYYGDARNGIIMMEYYKPLVSIRGGQKYIIGRLMKKCMAQLWPEAKKDYTSMDIHSANIGVNEDNDNVVFIDLGYFLPIGEGLADW